jgi:folylpolyglutamate synthase/dihydropteroate synthase
MTDVVLASSIQQAIDMAPNDSVTVITGSLFLLGQAKELLLQDD